MQKPHIHACILWWRCKNPIFTRESMVFIQFGQPAENLIYIRVKTGFCSILGPGYPRLADRYVAGCAGDTPGARNRTFVHCSALPGCPGMSPGISRERVLGHPGSAEQDFSALLRAPGLSWDVLRHPGTSRERGTVLFRTAPRSRDVPGCPGRSRDIPGARNRTFPHCPTLPGCPGMSRDIPEHPGSSE